MAAEAAHQQVVPIICQCLRGSAAPFPQPLPQHCCACKGPAACWPAQLVQPSHAAVGICAARLVHRG
eukprot:1161671-Pelagomonas_calceolata.AAC.15